MMWFAWTVIPMFQVILNRYNRHRWESIQMWHNLLGFTAFAVMTTAFILIWKQKNWKLSLSGYYHFPLGAATVGLGTALVFGGIFAWTYRSMPNTWNTNKMLRLKRIHIYFGYFMVLWV